MNSRGIAVLEAVRSNVPRLCAYLRSPGSWRDGVCLGLLVLAGIGYEFFLRAYLEGIPQQVQLTSAFTGSLAVALWYEVNKHDWRGSLIRVTATTMVFMAAAALAPYARHEFFVMLEEVKAKPRAIQIFTVEGMALMSNPLAGFGGMFGVSVVLIRASCGGFIVRMLSKLGKHDASVQHCPHCQGTIPR